MIKPRSLRRVHRLTVAAYDYVCQDNRKMKRRRPGASPIRRQVQGSLLQLRRSYPSTNEFSMRGNTLSIPAHEQSETPTRRHQSDGVTHPDSTHDPARLIAQAAANPAVSDRALRVYIVVAAVHNREVDAPLIAKTLPNLTEPQASRLLGDLVTAGLLTKRLRVVGYKPATPKPLRIRRGVYSLVGGAR